MEYPGTQITKKWRLAIMILFIAMFFVLAPTILIYAMGFRYDSNTKKLLGRGAISVDIKTNYGDVYLNDLKLKKNYLNSKTEVKDIVPGKYSLTIQTPNYYDWGKNIEIESNKTVYIKEINLIRKNDPVILINQNIDNLSLAPNGQYLVYLASKNNQQTLNIYNTKTNTDQSNLVINKDEYEIKWEENGNCFYLHGIGQGKTKIFCPDGQQIKQFSLPNDITKLQWKANVSDPELYYSDQSNIQSFKPLTTGNQLIVANKYVDWFFDSNQLWTIQTNTTTNELEFWQDTLGFKSLFKNLKPIGGLSKNIIDNQQRYSLIIVKDDNLLIRDNEADKVIIINPEKDYTLNAQYFLLSTHNDWWIMWSSFEMWTYIENSTPELQTRSGNNLKNVLPIDEYNALLLVWDKSASYLYPYYLVQGNLTDISINQLQADATNRILYFSRKDMAGLWKLAY